MNAVKPVSVTAAVPSSALSQRTHDFCFWIKALLLLTLLTISACGGGGGGGDGKSDNDDSTTATTPEPGITLTTLRYRLTESAAPLTLWTAAVTERTRQTDTVPAAEGSGLLVSAARNEFESMQLIVGPAAGNVAVTMTPFPDLGPDQRIELNSAGFDSGWANPLTPMAQGFALDLDPANPTVIWVNLYIPPGAPAGEHRTVLSLVPSVGNAIDIPVRLYVFDFALPAEINFTSLINLSIATLTGSGLSVEEAKTLLFENRMTPKSVTYPSSFNYQITWDNFASPNPCEILYDEPTEPDQFSISKLAPKYILGNGWNGVGFPDALGFQFVSNSEPRPNTFCGISRGASHFSSAAYNTEWQQFLGALDAYLAANNLSERVFYYVMNEPQAGADEDLAAYLCDLTRTAAPGLRLAISEEPKPEIAEHALTPCGYDIWIANTMQYQKDYAWNRQDKNGEQVWWYGFPADPEPWLNPNSALGQGLEIRGMPWAAWNLRVRGWEDSQPGHLFIGAQPSISAALLRDGLEDYEYLYRVNGSAHPQPTAAATPDPVVQLVAHNLKAWNRNPDHLPALRHELGRYLEGSRSTLPDLSVLEPDRNRGAYYLNFQDPAGLPAVDPLIENGNTYLKIGWEAYSEILGWGWFGGDLANNAISQFGYDSTAGFSEVERSYVYNDFGRVALFEFELENGSYLVTVGAGRPARGYPNDPHNVAVEGVAIIDDVPTSNANPTIESSQVIELRDGRLSVEVGGRSAATGLPAFTFLRYITILPR